MHTQIWRLWIIWNRNIWLCVPFVRTVLRRISHRTRILNSVFVLIPQIVFCVASGGKATGPQAAVFPPVD